jgi:hypothetical protein
MNRNVLSRETASLGWSWELFLFFGGGGAEQDYLPLACLLRQRPFICSNTPHTIDVMYQYRIFLLKFFEGEGVTTWSEARSDSTTPPDPTRVGWFTEGNAGVSPFRL